MAGTGLEPGVLTGIMMKVPVKATSHHVYRNRHPTRLGVLCAAGHTFNNRQGLFQQAFNLTVSSLHEYHPSHTFLVLASLIGLEVGYSIA